MKERRSIDREYIPVACNGIQLVKIIPSEITFRALVRTIIEQVYHFSPPYSLPRQRGKGRALQLSLAVGNAKRPKCGTQANGRALLAVIGKLCGRFEFAIGGVDQILRFLRMTAELVFVLFLSFVDLSVGLLEMMLRVREIRMPVTVNVDDGALGEREPAENQGSSKQEAQHKIAALHGDFLLYALFL